MLLQFTLLVTLGFVGQGEQNLVSDQFNQHPLPNAKIYTRILERIGNTVRVSGIDQEILVSAELSLPRIDDQNSDACLSLRLLDHGDHLEIIAIHDEVEMTEVVAEQLILRNQAIDNSEWDQVTSIDRFLVRESKTEDRWELWKSLRTGYSTHQAQWLDLGGDFFSGSETLANLIEEHDLAQVAISAGLHPFRSTWISSEDLASHLGLRKGTDGLVSAKRSLLLDQANHGLKEMLEKAARKSSSAGLGIGSQRKSVRSVWGDPQQVHWVRVNRHMIEEWTYQDRFVRLINGRVYELQKPAEVSMQSD